MFVWRWILILLGGILGAIVSWLDLQATDQPKSVLPTCNQPKGVLPTFH